jgi:thymidylate synthase
MIKADLYYKKNLKDILDNGYYDENPRPSYRDGVKAHTKFITQVFEKYDISKGQFPITTLRNTAIKTGINEILWIYQKQTNNLDVAKSMGVNWWDEWDIGDGTIGQRYGATVSKWDMINELLKKLKEDPFGRRHIINLYQYSDLKESKGLYPCAFETMWSVIKKNNEYYLDLTLVQRSNDYIMAGYINKIQYVALQMMIASHLGYKVGVFSHLVQNLHIYDRHIEAANEILLKESSNIQPKLSLKCDKNFYDFTVDDFVIENNIGSKLKSNIEIAI